MSWASRSKWCAWPSGLTIETTSPSKAAKTTLPFTGLDLRWTIGVGLLLIGSGLVIVGAQYRHRRRVDG